MDAFFTSVRATETLQIVIQTSYESRKPYLLLSSLLRRPVFLGFLAQLGPPLLFFLLLLKLFFLPLLQFLDKYKSTRVVLR